MSVMLPMCQFANDQFAYVSSRFAKVLCQFANTCMSVCQCLNTSLKKAYNLVKNYQRISWLVTFLFIGFCAIEELEESHEGTDFGFDRYITSEGLQGGYHTLVQELRLHDREFFFRQDFQTVWFVQFTGKLTDLKYELIVNARFTRMSLEHFEDLSTLVGLFKAEKLCQSRSTIPEARCLMVTLKYLATEDFQSRSFLFCLGKSIISNLLRETYKEIWFVL